MKKKERLEYQLFFPNESNIRMRMWFDLDKISECLKKLLLQLWTTNYSWTSSIFKWHRGSSEATLSLSGFLQHIHCPFHYSWCVFSDSALNHEEYSCLSSERLLWNRGESVHELHTLEGLFSSGFCPIVWTGTTFSRLELSLEGKRELVNKMYRGWTYGGIPS